MPAQVLESKSIFHYVLHSIRHKICHNIRHMFVFRLIGRQPLRLHELFDLKRFPIICDFSL